VSIGVERATTEISSTISGESLAGMLRSSEPVMTVVFWVNVALVGDRDGGLDVVPGDHHDADSRLLQIADGGDGPRAE
jgi:hypothetical protein